MCDVKISNYNIILKHIPKSQPLFCVCVNAADRLLTAHMQSVNVAINVWWLPWFLVLMWVVIYIWEWAFLVMWEHCNRREEEHVDCDACSQGKIASDCLWFCWTFTADTNGLNALFKCLCKPMLFNKGHFDHIVSLKPISTIYKTIINTRWGKVACTIKCPHCEAQINSPKKIR